MKKRSDNPFGDSELPSRSTGLETGTVSERRAGNPRSDKERIERHKEVMDDSSESGEFIVMENEGVVHFRRKGFEGAIIPPVEKKISSPTSLKDTWAEHRVKKRIK